MKVVHTYLKTEFGGSFRETILQSMLLSTLLAKKHYDKVELYTDKKTAKIVREIGIPYTDIHTDELDEIKLKSYTIPKVHTYTFLNEPYLHIDLDTFLFSKPTDLNYKTVWACYPEGGDELDFHIHNKNFYHTYVQSAFQIQDKLPLELLPYVKFSNVPNFCIFGGYNYQLIAEASKYALDIYNKFEEFFNQDYYYSIMLEQLLIPAIIRLSLDKMGDIRMDPDTFSFFFNQNPTYVISDKEDDYKMTFENNGKIISSFNQNDFYDLVSYDFNGFLHLNGYKDLEQIIFILRQRSLNEFKAFDQVVKIDKLFSKSEKYNTLIKNYNKRKLL